MATKKAAAKTANTWEIKDRLYELQIQNIPVIYILKVETSFGSMRKKDMSVKLNTLKIKKLFL